MNTPCCLVRISLFSVVIGPKLTITSERLQRKDKRSDKHVFVELKVLIMQVFQRDFRKVMLVNMKQWLVYSKQDRETTMSSNELYIR